MTTGIDIQDDPGPATVLLTRWAQGDLAALETLIPLVFDELRAIALKCFRKESPSHTLQPTALVSEVWFRLHDSRIATWRSRAEFYQFAARIMRRLLVDHARKHRAKKRGAEHRLTFSSEALEIPELPTHLSAQILDVDRAIKKLDRLDPRAASIVRYRYFIGLTIREIAQVLEVTERTVHRDWAIAKRFLAMHLET